MGHRKEGINELESEARIGEFTKETKMEKMKTSLRGIRIDCQKERIQEMEKMWDLKK